MVGGGVSVMSMLLQNGHINVLQIVVITIILSVVLLRACVALAGPWMCTC